MNAPRPDWDQAGYEAAVSKGMPRLPGDDINLQPVTLDALVLAYTERMAGQSRQGLADNLREFAARVQRRASPPLLDRETARQRIWRSLAGSGFAGIFRDELAEMMADAVMEIARPVPTRETLAAAVDPEAFDETRKRSQHPAAVVQWAARQHMAYKAADAALALLKGAES